MDNSNSSHMPEKMQYRVYIRQKKQFYNAISEARGKLPKDAERAAEGKKDEIPPNTIQEITDRSTHQIEHRIFDPIRSFASTESLNRHRSLKLEGSLSNRVKAEEAQELLPG